eukprot:119039_1
MGCLNSTHTANAVTSKNEVQTSTVQTSTEEKKNDSQLETKEDIIQYDLGPKHKMQPIQTYINKPFKTLTPNELDAMEDSINQIMLYQLSGEEHQMFMQFVEFSVFSQDCQPFVWRKGKYAKGEWRKIIYYYFFALQQFYSFDKSAGKYIMQSNFKTNTFYNEAFRSMEIPHKLLNKAWNFVADTLKGDPKELSKNKMLKSRAMFTAKNTFQFMDNMNPKLWNSIKNCSKNQLDTLGDILDKQYKDEKWGEIIINNKLKFNLCGIERQDHETLLGSAKPWWPTDKAKLNAVANQYISAGAGAADWDKYLEHWKRLGLSTQDPIRDNGMTIGSFRSCVVSDWIILMLEACGNAINDEFQNDITHLFGESRHMKAGVKSYNRMKWKAENDYSKETHQPYACRLQDVVRCAVKCKDCNELIESFNKLIDKYSKSGIVKVKNTFDKSMKIEFGYRAVYVCFVYESKQEKYKNIKMICEVQLTLDAVIRVRNWMHVFYGFYRSDEAKELCQF